jgi:hypothetical protein
LETAGKYTLASGNYLEFPAIPFRQNFMETSATKNKFEMQRQFSNMLQKIRKIH